MADARTPLQLLESRSRGAPTVATPFAASAIAAVDGEHLLLVEGASAFAHACGRLKSKASLRERVNAGGRRLVDDRYSATALQGVVDTACEGLFVEPEGA